MKNYIAVCHAFDFYGRWIGMGTREAIEKRYLHRDGIWYWCRTEWFVDGWRER
jgi:hypothetical protein